MSALRVVISAPGWAAKALGISRFIDGIICRLHGSCHGDFVEAVNKVGKAGYRRGNPNGWDYYLSNGIELPRNLADPMNAQAWYLGSGYWEKLKNAGLNKCCLKSKWPPAEAFPELKPRIQVKLMQSPDGKRFLIDPEVFDANTYQKEVDSYLQTHVGTSVQPVAPIAGGANLLLPILLWGLTRKG